MLFPLDVKKFIFVDADQVNKRVSSNFRIFFYEVICFIVKEARLFSFSSLFTFLSVKSKRQKDTPYFKIVKVKMIGN